MAAMIASDPDALPKGEPLLAELRASWAGQGGLDALVDAAEAMLLAESDAERRAASESFGACLFALSGGTETGRQRWGPPWASGVVDAHPRARGLLGTARPFAPPPSPTF